jgi:ribosomal protein S8
MVLKNEIDKFMKYTREFLNKLQVGYKCRSFSITIFLNKENIAIVDFFYQRNWIKMYTVDENKITIYLRYINNKPLFTKIKFISTPGYRKYYSKKSIPFFKKSIGGNVNIMMYTIYGLQTINYIEDTLINIGGEISFVLYE